MKNSEVSDIFLKIAQLLEIKGDNPFRIRAYIRAADTLNSLGGDIQGYLTSSRLEEIPGIGHDLASKIKEIFKTGRCRHYEELKKTVPDGVLKMLEIPEVGPKSAKLFFDKLKIKSVKDLQKAAKSGRLLTLPGIKQKTVDNILKGITQLEKGGERMNILQASTICTAVIDALKKIKEVKKISAAGSLRRMKDSIRDIDILVVTKNVKKVTDTFTALPEVKRVLAKGQRKSSIITKDDKQVDLRLFDSRSFGAALLYFTGSKNHNIKLRQLAMNKNLKVNEYGIFDSKNRCLASRSEEEMYRRLGLDCIAPELREDTGEVEAAMEHRLPKLLEMTQIKGDFHAHTNYSDGQDSIEDMAQAAIRLGYEYICLTDHSVNLRVANGLDAARVKKKRKEVDRVNKKLKNFRIVFGTEVEIDSNGNTDYNYDILSQFEIVVAAIHSGFKQSKEQLTRRIVNACKNKYVHIIAHPTGKLWPKRAPYEVDFKQIFKVARETNTALEINAHPWRLDLADINARWAKEEKVMLAIGTDSHAQGHLKFMEFGLGLARRAWLCKKDVLNTLGVDKLFRALKK